MSLARSITQIPGRFIVLSRVGVIHVPPSPPFPHKRISCFFLCRLRSFVRLNEMKITNNVLLPQTMLAATTNRIVPIQRYLYKLSI